jgi:hypothetical protein
MMRMTLNRDHTTFLGLFWLFAELFGEGRKAGKAGNAARKTKER